MLRCVLVGGLCNFNCSFVDPVGDFLADKKNADLILEMFFFLLMCQLLAPRHLTIFRLFRLFFPGVSLIGATDKIAIMESRRGKSTP